jgi:hypothetical protein
MSAQQAGVLTSDVDQWRVRIAAAWQRTVESVVEVGRLINESRDQLGATYALLETELPFSSTVAAFLSKIAKNPVLSDPANFAKLPSGINTLYHLTFIEEEELRKQIEHGEISPDFTLNEAKALREPKTAQGRSGSAITKPKESNLVEVGVLSVSIPKSLDKFSQDLAALLEKYKGQISLSRGTSSLAELHRTKLHDLAVQNIAKVEDGIKPVDLETMRIFEDAILFLQKDKDGKYRKEIEIDGKPVQRSCLPTDYPDFKALKKWLGTSEITRGLLLTYCIDKRIPVRYVDTKDIDKEFYIWEQVRLYTAKKDTNGSLKRLRDLAARSTYPNIRKLAHQVLAEIARFG